MKKIIYVFLLAGLFSCKSEKEKYEEHYDEVINNTLSIYYFDYFDLDLGFNIKFTPVDSASYEITNLKYLAYYGEYINDKLFQEVEKDLEGLNALDMLPCDKLQQNHKDVLTFILDRKEVMLKVVEYLKDSKKGRTYTEQEKRDINSFIYNNYDKPYKERFMAERFKLYSSNNAHSKFQKYFDETLASCIIK